MSLSADLQQFSANFQSGYNTGSADKFRQSLEAMRDTQAAQAKAAAQDGQKKLFTSFVGAADKGYGPGVKGGLEPGQEIVPGSLTWARQTLPHAQYQTAVTNLENAGYSGQQLATGLQAIPDPTSLGPSTPAATADQVASEGYMGNAVATAQAKGGVVPRKGYAGGGPVDPDQAQAIAASNGQPNAPAAGGAIPMPPPSAPPPPQAAMPPPGPPPTQANGPAVPVPPPQGGAPGPAQANGPAVPMPPQSAPPGGMQPIHPPGMKPPVGIDKPQPVPASAVSAQTPAGAAMAHAAVALGLHPGVSPASSPQLAANYTENEHGAGAASNEQVHAFRKAVAGSSENGEPLGIQNASLINNLYNYDMMYHGPQQAAADSFGLLQNFRINMQMYGGAAIASFDNGNLGAAAHYLEQAYAFFPDGNEVQVKPGANGGLVATRTDPDGKVIDSNTFSTAQDLQKFAEASTDFKTYNTMLDNSQKLALQTLDVKNQMTNRDENTALRSQEVGDQGRNIDSEITTRGRSAADDDARTAVAQQHLVDEEKNGGMKPPSPGEMNVYQADVENELDPSNTSGLGASLKLPPEKVELLTPLAVNIGAVNGMPSQSAIKIAMMIARQPSLYDPKTGTATINGRSFRLNSAAALQLDRIANGGGTQNKATGGVVTPAARAMANLPS